MAKLDNVKVIVGTIEVSGVVYSQVTREAKAGDIVRHDASGFDYLPQGAFYLAFIDGDGDLVVTDEDGDNMLIDDDYAVFEKVTEKPASTSKRLTVGDYAKIVGNNVNGHDYNPNSIVKITWASGYGGSDRSYKAERADGTTGNYLWERNTERASEAEFNAQKQPPAAPVSDEFDVITHEGRQYRKVARKANVGELITPLKCGMDYTAGRVYTVIDTSGKSFQDAHFIDNVGDNYYLLLANYSVLEPVESATPKQPPVLPSQYVIRDGKVYVKEVRVAKVGELVIVVTASANHGYKNGDILTVVKSPRWEWENGSISVSETTCGLFLKEYNVLVPTNFVTIGGDIYTLESRKARAGERVLIVENFAYGKARDIVGVKSRDVNNPDYGVRTEADNLMRDSRYVVLTPKQAEKPQPKRLAVGEYAKIIDDKTRSGSTNCSAKIGDIRKVVLDDGTSAPYKAEKLDGSDYEWYRAESLVRATDEEVAEAKAQLEAKLLRNQFTVGDKVRLISGGGAFPLNGYDNGSVYEIADTNYAHDKGTRIKIVGGRVTSGYATPEQLEKYIEVQPPQPTRIPVGAYVKIAEGSVGTIRNYIGEIVVVSDSGKPYQLRTIGGKDIGPAYDHEVTQVTAAEVSEAQAKLGRKTRSGDFNVGDTAILTDLSGAVCGFKIGDKVTVKGREGSGRHALTIINGNATGYVNATSLMRLPPEEAKWAAIGRKVNEYKASDIIEITRYQCGDKVGTVTEVTEITGANSLRIKSPTRPNGGTFSADVDAIKLVTPVEKRFDRAAA